MVQFNRLMTPTTSVSQAVSGRIYDGDNLFPPNNVRWEQTTMSYAFVIAQSQTGPKSNAMSHHGVTLNKKMNKSIITTKR